MRLARIVLLSMLLLIPALAFAQPAPPIDVTGPRDTIAAVVVVPPDTAGVAALQAGISLFLLAIFEGLPVPIAEFVGRYAGSAIAGFSVWGGVSLLTLFVTLLLRVTPWVRTVIKPWWDRIKPVALPILIAISSFALTGNPAWGFVAEGVRSTVKKIRETFMKKTDAGVAKARVAALLLVGALADPMPAAAAPSPVAFAIGGGYRYEHALSEDRYVPYFEGRTGYVIGDHLKIELGGSRDLAKERPETGARVTALFTF